MNEIRIKFKNGKLFVPNKPIIPFIEGDGPGPVIWKATKTVIDTAVYKTYGGIREIQWNEILAGEKALEKTGEYLPEKTVLNLKKFIVGIKGPIEVGTKTEKRNIDVVLRQRLNLYATLSPLRGYEGLPEPEKNRMNMNLFIFRKKLEDIYSGVERLNSSFKIENLKELFLKGIGINSLPFSENEFPEANINWETGISIFEGVNCSITKKSAQTKISSSSQILSGAMMLEYIGWREASDKILQGVHEALREKSFPNSFVESIKKENNFPYYGFAKTVIKNM